MLFVGDTLFADMILFICTRMDILLETMQVFTEEGNQRDLFAKGIKYHSKILS